MTNQDWIKQYSGKDDIIASYYQLKNQSGNVKIIDGLVNPIEIDNTNICSPTDDQSTTPHCAGYSCAQLLEAIHWKRTGKLIQLDAHQIYALAKQKDGAVNVEGTYLESALQAGIQLCGLKNSKIQTLMSDKSDRTIEQLKFIIHKYDICIAGFDISTGWQICNEDDYDIMHTEQSLGGHAVVVCGYDQKGFIIQNHWSKNWGAKGFCRMPYNVFIKEFMYAAWLTNMYDNFD